MRNFLRKLLVSLLAAASLAGGLVITGDQAAGYGGFEDVLPWQYYADAVAWMSHEGITTGTNVGCFSPGDEVTRAQAAAFLHRLAGASGTAGPHPFVDVGPGWQDAAVAWMWANGITRGTDDTHFAPNRSLTRGEFAALLYRYDGAQYAGSQPFIDVRVRYMQIPVGWLAHSGITNGIDESHFAPDRTITRGELATMLWRYVGKPIVDPAPDLACRAAHHSRDYVTPDSIGISVGPGVIAPPPTAVVDGHTISADGTTLADVIVDGCLIISADNVTVRNVVVNCTNSYPIKTIGAHNVRIQHSQINCWGNGTKGIYFLASSDFVVDRVEITGCDDQFFIDGGLGYSIITNSVFHNQAPGSAAHTDGMQIGEFDLTSGTLAVDGNWWEYNRLGCCENAVMFLASHAAVTAEVRHNYLDGDFGTHLLRCHSSAECIIEFNVIAYEPDGLVVYDTSSRQGVARCNTYPTGQVVPARLFSGITVDNAGC